MPEMAKDDQAIMAITSRGILNSRIKICVCCPSSNENMARKKSCRPTDVAPLDKCSPINTRSRTTSKKNNKYVDLPVFKVQCFGKNTFLLLDYLYLKRLELGRTKYDGVRWHSIPSIYSFDENNNILLSFLHNGNTLI